MAQYLSDRVQLEEGSEVFLRRTSTRPKVLHGQVVGVATLTAETLPCAARLAHHRREPQIGETVYKVHCDGDEPGAFRLCRRDDFRPAP